MSERMVMGSKRLGGFPPKAGGLPVLALTDDPTVVPTDSAPSQFGVYAGTLFIHLNGGANTNWIDLGKVSILASIEPQLLAIQQALYVLGAAAAYARAVISMAPAAAWNNNDYFDLPNASGGRIRVEAQVDGTFVPSVVPGEVVYTADLRPVFPGGTWDDVSAVFNAVIAAHTALEFPSGGSGSQVLQWPAVGTVGNGHAITGFAVNGGSTLAFTPTFSGGVDSGDTNLLPPLVRVATSVPLFHFEKVCDYTEFQSVPGAISARVPFSLPAGALGIVSARIVLSVGFGPQGAFALGRDSDPLAQELCAYQNAQVQGAIIEGPAGGTSSRSPSDVPAGATLGVTVAMGGGQHMSDLTGGRLVVQIAYT